MLCFSHSVVFVIIKRACSALHVCSMQVFLPEAVSQIRSAGAPHTSCVSSGDQTVNVSVVQLPSRLKVTEPLYQSKTKTQCALYSLQSEADQ